MSKIACSVELFSRNPYCELSELSKILYLPRYYVRPGACNYPMFLSRRFHRPIYFYLKFYLEVQIPTGTSVTNCNHKFGLMLTCRHVHVRPRCSTLTEACSCRLQLAYFAGKNYLKIDWSVEMLLHWLIMGVAGS